MVEISPHLPTPSVLGWVRGVFAGRISQRTSEAIQPLGEVRPAIAGPTPVFESRFNLSREKQRRLTEDTLAYNKAKYALDPTDPVAYVSLMATYDALMKRYAPPSSREAARPVFERVDQQYLSPFQPSPSVTPALSTVLGSD